MDNDIKVSIVVPVYNVEKYLSRCLDSLLAQSLDKIEIIAVDDISTDNSYTILKQYEKENPDKIRVFQLPVKGRQGAARNMGIRESKGEYIGFVDSDDYVKADMYETLYRLANKFQVDMVYGGYYEDVGSSKNIISTASALGKAENRIEISKENREDFMVEMRSFWCSLFCSKLFKEEDVFFPERLAYEDNYFGVVVKYFIRSFAYIDRPLYCYNRTNVNSTTSLRNSMHHMDRIKTANMALDFFKKQNDYYQIKKAVEYIYLEHFYMHTVSCMVYYYDDINYTIIKQVRDKFMNEFPEYKHNCYYIHKFGKAKRIIFQINEWSPYVYAKIYKLFRLISRMRKK